MAFFREASDIEKEKNPSRGILEGFIPKGLMDENYAPSNLVPWEIPDQAVKKFVDSPLIAQATGRQNIGNIPMNQLLPMLINAPPPESSPVIPPSSPAGGGLIPTQNVAQTPKSAADRAREDAMREWQEHQSKMQGPQVGSMFGLSADFFSRHPEISGGVFVGPGGPKFLFNDNKPKDIISQAQSLIQDYTNKISSGQAAIEGRVGFYNDMIKELTGQVSGMTTAQTGATKAPSEIAANMANATRPQIVPNVISGPGGEMSTFLLPPGGAPNKIATGISPSAEHGANIGSLVTNIYTHFMTEAAKVESDPLVPPEQKKIALAAMEDRARNAINGIQSMMNKPGTGAPKAKLTDDQYINMFMAKNPKSDRTTAAQYLRNARTQHPELFQ